MKPDSSPPSPADPQARLTALLLGELAPTEAAEVQAALERDPELRRLEGQLRQTISLVREALVQPAADPAAPDAPPRLSEARRAKLFAAFKVVAPRHAFWRPDIPWGWCLRMAAAAAAIVLSLAALLPQFINARSKGFAPEFPLSPAVDRTDLSRLALEPPSARPQLDFFKSAGRVVTDAQPDSSKREAAPTLGGEPARDQPTLGAEVQLGQRLYFRQDQPAAVRADPGPAVPAQNRGEIFLPTQTTDDYSAIAPPTETTTFMVQANGARFDMGRPTPSTAPAPVAPARARSLRVGVESPATSELAPATEALQMRRYGLAPKSAAPTAPAASPQSTAALGLLPSQVDGLESEARTRGLARTATNTPAAGAFYGGYAAQGMANQPVPSTTWAFTPPDSLADFNGRSLGAAESAGERVAGGSSLGFGRGGLLAGGGLGGGGGMGGFGGASGSGQGDAGVVQAGRAVGQEVAEAGGAELAPLPLKLPMPAFMGTPTDIPLARAGSARGRAAGRAGGVNRSQELFESAPTPAPSKPSSPAPAPAPVQIESLVAGEPVTVTFGELDAKPNAHRFAVPTEGAAATAAPGVERYEERVVALAVEAKAKEAVDKAPVLGDVPLVGKGFRLESQLAAGTTVRQLAEAEIERVREGEGRLWFEQLKRVEDLAGPVEAPAPQTVREDRLAEGAQRSSQAGAARDELALRLKDTEVLRESLETRAVEVPDQAAEELAKGVKLEARDSARKQAALVPAAPAGPAPAPAPVDESRPAPRPVGPPPEPQPEVATAENAFSTFSLNVTDVSFKLAAASLEKGSMPDTATVRSEEFLNAFDYRDPEPGPGVPIAFAWERARDPFAHNRELLRFSVQTAARGREPGRALNLVFLLDSSGSMERADRVAIIRQALAVLASQLQPQDRISVVAFARTARLWVDGLPGNQAGELLERVGHLTPEGGTNLEDALKLGYETAMRHFLSQGVNRLILLTDGAANLGDLDPASLRRQVESHRQRGIALDSFGIGWEGYNDDLLEVLTRNGDGRYGFINSPAEAATEFVGQLTGALQVAAADVKVQVEFNPQRVAAWRQIGYAKHKLTKEQFRDNTVDAAELGAAESGNALYALELEPRGDGPIGIVRARYRVPATGEYLEHEWPVPYTGAGPLLEQASPAMRLAAVACAFSEWLVSSPFAGGVNPDLLLGYLRGVPDLFEPDPRPRKLEWMIRQAKSIFGQ